LTFSNGGGYTFSILKERLNMKKQIKVSVVALSILATTSIGVGTIVGMTSCAEKERTTNESFASPSDAKTYLDKHIDSQPD
jgi:hypothetical protein